VTRRGNHGPFSIKVLAGGWPDRRRAARRSRAVTIPAQSQSAAARFARYPVPPCADPHGYLAALLGDVQAAAASAGTAQGLSDLVHALVPLKQVAELESEYTAELKRTTGL
jgi:hypothetical protein